MTIKIPDKFMGKPIQGSIERVLAGADSQQTSSQENEQKIVMDFTRIQNPKDYIQIPQYNTIITLRETHKGLNFYDSLEAVAQEGFKIPSPQKFMRHWLNVREAAVNKSQILYYANGEPIDKIVTEDLWKYLSTGHNGGCWTWLNALFKEDGTIYMETDLSVAKNGRKKTLHGVRQNLDPYLEEDSFADINFNAQGLPNRKSSNQSYSQGNNIFFYHPRKNAVAWFVSNSGGAVLDCGGYPSGSDASLGVFACAEGAPTP